MFNLNSLRHSFYSIFLRIAGVILFLFLFTSCMKWDYVNDFSDFDEKSPGLFIISEGNFQYSNASLSFYNPVSNSVQNEIFFRANGMKLGDVAQSMTIYDNKGWIVVNNSHVIFAIDVDTYKETGRIENLTSPRYIHFISENKAYVTQIWDNRIFIIDPQKYEITGYIEVPFMQQSTGSTEQMVSVGKYVYCNCWSYQNKIIKIDSETDEIVDYLEVGVQPNSIVKDKNGNLWAITDGGYENSVYGYEVPALYCINTTDFKIEKRFYFSLGQSPSEIVINGRGDILYWINNDVWRMEIDEDTLPAMPFIPFQDTHYYGLTIDPETEDIYVADAIDYSQQGMIYRYNSQGELIDNFYVGVTPGAFCWKN